MDPNLVKVLYDLNRYWRKYALGNISEADKVGTADILGKAADLIADLSDQLEKAIHERNMAIGQLSEMTEACRYCLHGESFNNDCNEEFGATGCVFEWSGSSTK